MERAEVKQVPLDVGAGQAYEEAALNDGALRELEALLREAGGSGDADPRALEVVAGLKDRVEKIESGWVAAKSFDGLHMYYAAKNIELVLVQMERGLRGCRSVSGRGRIASDSLAMLPVMDRALGIVQSENADPALVMRAREAAREVMAKSVDVGLDTPLEEIYANMDWNKWNRKIPLLMKILES